ncbi:alpha/beta hydrolase family protein [candidate division KSB1 bacterium]
MKNLITFLLCTVLFISGFSQTNTLPKPSGKYLTGITYLNFTDNTRKELFDNTGEKNRELTLKVWYPAETSTNPEPYFPDPEFAVTKLQYPESFRDMKTNSSRDVPVSPGETKYPVLIFSHGWGEHFSQNSILMEELASLGYIIFSMAHHYECKFSYYPDGRILNMDFQSQRFQKIWREMQNPKGMELLIKMYSASNDEERRQVFVEMGNLLPTGLIESPKYWAEDISFFINRLKDINKENELFKNKLDLDRIGVFGMSMGGIASSEFCLTDNRIKAGISMDGGTGPSSLEKKFQIPFMYLNGKRFLGYGKLFTGRSASDCYSLSVRGSDHYNFTDHSIYPIPIVSRLLGEIDGKKVIEITNVIVTAFFDKYLKEKQDINIIKEAKAFPEIEIASNINRN